MSPREIRGFLYGRAALRFCFPQPLADDGSTAPPFAGLTTCLVLPRLQAERTKSEAKISMASLAAFAADWYYLVGISCAD